MSEGRSDMEGERVRALLLCIKREMHRIGEAALLPLQAERSAEDEEVSR